MEATTPQSQPHHRIIKVPAPSGHPDGLYEYADWGAGCYAWSMPRLPRHAGRAAALHWEMALWRLSGVHECGRFDGYHDTLPRAIHDLRQVRANPAAKPMQLFNALYYASLLSLEEGRVAQARRLWREALTLSTNVKSSRTCDIRRPNAMKALSLLAIRLHIDQPGWPLWGPVVPPNPRPAMPVDLPVPVRKLLFRYAKWFTPAIVLNSMWGRLIASIGGDEAETVALAGFIHNFVIAINNNCWNPNGKFVDRELDAWSSTRGSFRRAGPYTGVWARSEGGTLDDQPFDVPNIEQYSADRWIAPHI